MSDECWLCAPGRGEEIYYTDAIGAFWCKDHYDEVYWMEEKRDAPE